VLKPTHLTTVRMSKLTDGTPSVGTLFAVKVLVVADSLAVADRMLSATPSGGCSVKVVVP